MISEQQMENSSLNAYRDEEQEHRNKYRRQAFDALDSIDFSVPQNKHQLAQSFRKVNKILAKIENDRFNLNDDHKMISQIAESAYFHQPYDLMNLELKFRTSICREAFIGNRRCKQPLIKIDNEIVNFEGKNQKIIIKDKQFMISLQAEPNCCIVYTNKPRSHPLLILTLQDNQQHFKKIVFQKCSQSMNPPCELCIIAVKQYSKVESKLLCLKVISNQGELSIGHKYEQGYAIRPQQSFNYEQSASGTPNSYSLNEQYS